MQLNVESIGNEDLLIEQTLKISEKLQDIGGRRETQFRWKNKSASGLRKIHYNVEK